MLPSTKSKIAAIARDLCGIPHIKPESETVTGTEIRMRREHSAAVIGGTVRTAVKLTAVGALVVIAVNTTEIRKNRSANFVPPPPIVDFQYFHDQLRNSTNSTGHL